MSEWDEDSTYDIPAENPDVLPYEAEETELHPNPEMMLIREAIKKGLTTQQRELWCMYAYDKLLQNEIATKLKISQQAVSQRIKTAEKAITRYCKKHKASYELLKEMEDNNDSVGC